MSLIRYTWSNMKAGKRRKTEKAAGRRSLPGLPAGEKDENGNLLPDKFWADTRRIPAAALSSEDSARAAITFWKTERRPVIGKKRTIDIQWKKAQTDGTGTADHDWYRI